MNRITNTTINRLCRAAACAAVALCATVSAPSAQAEAAPKGPSKMRVAKVQCSGRTVVRHHRNKTVVKLLGKTRAERKCRIRTVLQDRRNNGIKGAAVVLVENSFADASGTQWQNGQWEDLWENGFDGENGSLEQETITGQNGSATFVIIISKPSTILQCLSNYLSGIILSKPIILIDESASDSSSSSFDGTMASSSGSLSSSPDTATAVSGSTSSSGCAQSSSSASSLINCNGGSSSWINSSSLCTDNGAATTIAGSSSESSMSSNGAMIFGTNEGSSSSSSHLSVIAWGGNY